jgi:Subtilase family
LACAAERRATGSESSQLDGYRYQRTRTLLKRSEIGAITVSAVLRKWGRIATQPIAKVSAVFRRAATLVGISLLIVGLTVVIPPFAWHGPPSALAATAGKGEGSNGNGPKAEKDKAKHQQNEKDAEGSVGADAGQGAGTDTGQSDAGPDTGQGDAGADAGQGDAGADAGQGDAGPDAGQGDVGADAGQGDAGPDAGQGDAGADAGQGDAGTDAGQSDAGADVGQGDAGADAGADPAEQVAAPTPAEQAAAPVPPEQAAAPVMANRARARQAAAERSGSEFVADEILVAHLRADAGMAMDGLGFVLLNERRLASLDLTIARLRVPRQMTARTARRLLADRYPGVLVDLNSLYRPQGQLVLPPPDYPTRLIGWGHVPGDCGQGIRIGLLDTAVDAAAQDLRGARIVQRLFVPADATAASREHASAIAAILVGRRAGLLPGAELAVAGAFDADPDGTPIADVMALVSGLDWLVARRARVINMSFAGDANAVVALALQRVIEGHAIVVVAAAGNGGPNAPPAFPAAEPGVIAVTAVDSRAQPYADANRGDYVAFAAPGVRIWTPSPTASGSYHTGTSFAAPFVTAAVAARLAGGAASDSQRLVDSLARTALDLGRPGRDPVFGRGLIQSANPCSTPTQ